MRIRLGSIRAVTIRILTCLGSLLITVVGHIGAGGIAVSDKCAALWIIHTEDSRWLEGAFHHFPMSLRTQ